MRALKYVALLFSTWALVPASSSAGQPRVLGRMHAEAFLGPLVLSEIERGSVLSLSGSLHTSEELATVLCRTILPIFHFFVFRKELLNC